MGLSDKLKQVTDKAKESAADHREQITNAVETAGVVADKRTRGRYSDKIAKATAKTGAAVDRFAGEPGADEGPSPTPPPPHQPPPTT
jgi:antitoxin protein of toxin-antitoxin system